MATRRTEEEVRRFALVLDGAALPDPASKPAPRGTTVPVARLRQRLSGLLISASDSPVQSEDETLVFYATRFSHRHFEGRLRDAAEAYGVDCAIEVERHLITCEIRATPTGGPQAVEQFRRYATGMSAAIDSAGVGAGGGGGG